VSITVSWQGGILSAYLRGLSSATSSLACINEWKNDSSCYDKACFQTDGLGPSKEIIKGKQSPLKQKFIKCLHCFGILVAARFLK
jgi:hypothetical protein